MSYPQRPLAPYDIVQTPDHGRAVIAEIDQRKVRVILIMPRSTRIDHQVMYPLEAVKRVGRIGGRSVEKYAPGIEKSRGTAFLCQYGVKADDFMALNYNPDQDGLSDALADIMHYARRYRLNFRRAMVDARRNFEAEAAELKPMGVKK